MNTPTDQRQPKIERKITGSITAMIQGHFEEIEAPLFAINWFDTRVEPVYHFYNWLAASRVFKIGGKVLFKGKNLQTISGNEALARKLLLIVNYPSAHAFLDLLSDRIFQVVSVFRVLAVKQFSFVLQKRIGEPQLLLEQIPKLEGPAKSYAVLHFSGIEDLQLESAKQQLDRIASTNGCDLMFYGYESGRVATVKTGEEPSEVEYITPATAVFSSAEQANLLKYFEGAEFEEFTKQLDDHYAALLERTM